MKKTYQKPNLKSVKLLCESSLLTASSVSYGGQINGSVDDNALSNKESEHDIWGDDGSSMWK